MLPSQATPARCTFVRQDVAYAATVNIGTKGLSAQVNVSGVGAKF
jgi:hypothetical protein